MKTRVNGYIIDVNMMQLGVLERCKVGDIVRDNKAYKNMISSMVLCTKQILLMCKEYQSAYRKIPYPINRIEDNIKYAAILDIMNKYYDKDNKIKYWINNGIHVIMGKVEVVLIGEQVYMHDSVQEDMPQTNTGIETYRDHIAYEQFKYVVNNADNIDEDEYISKFYGNIREACENRTEFMWVFDRIFSMTKVPPRIEIDKNDIIDGSRRYKVNISEINKAKVETGTRCIDLTSNDLGIHKTYKEVKIYDYSIFDEKKNRTIPKNELLGMNSMCAMLSKHNNITKGKEVVHYGVICGNNIIEEINGNIYATDRNIIGTTREVVDNAKIYSLMQDRVYIEQRKRIQYNIEKRIMYVYVPENKSLNIVAIDICKV